MPALTKQLPHAIRLFWVLADQGIFALSNFVLNILFARWLPAADYGMFAISFSGYLFLTLLHHGIVVDPLLMQAPKVDANRHWSYVIAISKAHGIINLAVAAICGVLFLVLPPAIGWGVLGAGIGGGMLLLLLTARRLCLIFLSTRVAALIGLVYFIGAVSTAYLLHRYDAVTWFKLWLVLGAWALVCSLVIFGVLYRTTRGTEPYTVATLYRLQARLALFATVAASFQWFRLEVILILLAMFGGLEAAAGLRAAFNIVSPLGQLNIALSASLLVQSASAHAHNKHISVWPTAIPYGIALFSLVGFSWFFAPQLVEAFYGGRYLEIVWQIPFAFLQAAFSALESFLASNLKGRGMLWQGFAPPVVGAVIATSVGLILVPLVGVAGAIYAVVASYGGGFALAVLLSRTGRS